MLYRHADLVGDSLVADFEEMLVSAEEDFQHCPVTKERFHTTWEDGGIVFTIYMLPTYYLRTIFILAKYYIHTILILATYYIHTILILATYYSPSPSKLYSCTIWEDCAI